MSQDNSEKAGCGLSYEIRKIRKTGTNNQETRVLWSGTKFQLQPRFSQLHAFLNYLGGCWSNYRRQREVFKNFNAPSEYEFLPNQFSLHREGKMINESDLFGDESIRRLFPLINWCNENLNEIAWDRFMATQRQQRHEVESKSYLQKRVALTDAAHENLCALAKHFGLSNSGFLEALKVTNQGLVLDEFWVQEDRRREAVKHFEQEKKAQEIVAARKRSKTGV